MIRAKALSTAAATCKELHYLLRVLAPIACRSSEIFVKVAKDILRVDLPFLTRRGKFRCFVTFNGCLIGADKLRIFILKVLNVECLKKIFDVSCIVINRG
jgi:hypothetical protein